MIKHVTGDVYKDERVNIVFNPVSVRAKNGFIERVKKIYPEAYTLYDEKVWMYSINELLGDVQLVHIREYKFVMNAFCKEKNGRINKLALAKTLVETCNLADDCKIVVGIENGLGIRKQQEKDWINTIIREVFKDIDIEVLLFERKNR